MGEKSSNFQCMLVICYGFVMQNLNVELLSVGSHHNFEKNYDFWGKIDFLWCFLEKAVIICKQFLWKINLKSWDDLKYQLTISRSWLCLKIWYFFRGQKHLGWIFHVWNSKKWHFSIKFIKNPFNYPSFKHFCNKHAIYEQYSVIWDQSQGSG